MACCCLATVAAAILALVGTFIWIFYPRFPKGSVGGSEYVKVGLLARFGTLVVLPIFKWKSGAHVTKLFRKLLDAEGKNLKNLPGTTSTSKTVDGIETAFVKPDGWQKSHGTMIYFNGGGYAVGTPLPQYRRVLERIALKTGLQIIAPNYRKAPEHKWPIPYEDCYKVLSNVLENADKYAIDLEKYCISGDSAGGQLTIATSMQLAKENRPAPKLVAPIYPTTGLFTNFSTPGQKKCQNHTYLSYQLISDFMIWLAGKEDESDPGLQKLFRSNCQNTPEWFETWHKYCMRYLTPYYGFEGFTPVEEMVRRSQSFKPTTKQEIEVYNELKSWMTDFRICQLRMSDDDLKQYLENGPKKHFYLTCELDMLRDEGIAFFKRLEEINNYEVACDARKRMAHFDCHGAPHAMVTLSEFGGGKVKYFNVYMNRYIDIVNELMSD